MTRPALILRIAAALIALLALAAIGVGMFVTSTSGRAYIMTRALPALSTAIDQQVLVKDISGNWPSHIELAGISVSDAHGVWLEIDRMNVIWRPLALLLGRVSISTLLTYDTHLLRLPHARTPAPTASSTPPNLNAIRRTLENIEIDDLTIETLRVDSAVFGNPASIAVRAALRASGGAPTLMAVIDRYDTPGSATLELVFGDNTLAINARAVIAGVDLDAAVAMSGDAETLSGSVKGSCGGNGFCVKWATGSLGAVTAEAVLGGTRVHPTAFVTFQLANAKDGTRSLETLGGLIGLVPDLDAQTLRLDGKGTAVGLQHALPEAGAVLGNDGKWSLAVTMKNGTAVIDSFAITAGDTEAMLAGTLTGNDLSSATMTLDLRGAGRLAGYPNDKTSRTHTELKITKGTLAPRLTASGTATIEISALPTDAIPAPPFKAPMRLSSKVALTPERLHLEALSGLWGPATLKGASTYAMTKAGMDHLETSATLTLAPNTFAAQSKPLLIDAKANGGIAVLSAAVTATLEDYKRGGSRLTAIKSSIQAKRDGASWRATVRTDAKLNDEPATLMAAVSQTLTDIIVNDLHLEGAGADLKGNLRFNMDSETTTGTLNGQITDLAPWMSLAGYPATGRGDLKLAFSGDAKQRVDLSLRVQRFASPVLGTDSMTLTAALEDVFNNAKVRARVEGVDGDILNRRFDQLTATADGSFKNLAVTLQSKGTRLERFSVDLVGALRFDGKTDIALSRFVLEDAALRASLPAPAHLSISDDAMILDPMRLNVGSGTVSAQFNLNRKAEQVKAKIALARLSLGDPKDILSSGQTFIDGTIDLSGAITKADAVADLTARFEPRDGGGTITAKVTARTQNGRAVIAGTAGGLSATDAKLNADIPVTVDLSTPKLAIDMQAPVSGTLTWRGEIKSLWQLLGNEDHTLAGQADIDLKVSGNMAEPAVTGGLRLTKALYENLASGAALHNIDLSVAAQSGSLVNVTLAATDTGAGALTAKGTLSKGGETPGWNVDMAGDMKAFHVLRRDDVTAAASGHVTYKGPVLAGTIGGNLQIVKSEYRLGESYQPEVPLLIGRPSDAAAAKESPIKLNVALSIPEVVRTEGKGLEAFWRGDIKATGDINHPNLVGELSLARGTFSFLGKTFDLESGTVTFTGGGQIDPELNITAVRQAEEITATVTISGRASQPQITLSSQPALPQDEVLARLLFRKGTTQLGPIESLQLANAAADLSGLSRGGLSGVLRRASGLDIVGFGGESGNAIVLGRQFSSALYIGIEQNVNDSTRRVVIEWRLTRQFSLQSTTTGETGADIGVLWRKNY